MTTVAVLYGGASAEREARIGGQVEGHEVGVGEDWTVFIEDDRVPVHVSHDGDGLWHVSMARGDGRDDEAQLATRWRPGEVLVRATLDDRPITVQVDRRGARWLLTHGGASAEVRVLRPRAAKLAALMPKKQPPDLSRYLLSPMPGLLVKLLVDEGTQVKAGEELAIVEAMKMENVLRAERDGTVSKLHAETGANLSVDQAILEFE